MSDQPTQVLSDLDTWPPGGGGPGEAAYTRAHLVPRVPCCWVSQALKPSSHTLWASLACVDDKAILVLRDRLWALLEQESCCPLRACC